MNNTFKNIDLYKKEICAVEFSDDVKKFVDLYDKKDIGDRDSFVWKWIKVVIETLNISPRPKKANEEKMLLSMFITIVDDIAEIEQDNQKFSKVQKIIRSDSPSITSDKTIQYFVDLWDCIIEKIQNAPEYPRFKELFYFDLETCFHSMNYTRIINNNPQMANFSELKEKDKYGMPLHLFVDIDLMYMADFKITELSSLRNITEKLCYMTRIGNWLATWRSEIAEGDLTSGVVVKAIEDEIVSIDQILNGEPTNCIKEIILEDVEDIIYQEWEETYQSIQQTDIDVDIVNITQLTNSTVDIMIHHLMRRKMEQRVFEED